MVDFSTSLNALSPMCHLRQMPLQTGIPASQFVYIPGAPLLPSGWKPGPEKGPGPGTDSPPRKAPCACTGSTKGSAGSPSEWADRRGLDLVPRSLIAGPCPNTEQRRWCHTGTNHRTLLPHRNKVGRRCPMSWALPGGSL